MPSTTVLAAVALVGARRRGAAMLVPPVRQWVLGRTFPVWRQTWPRLVQLLGQPQRFAVAIAGNLIMTLGYLGRLLRQPRRVRPARLSLIDLALVYLLGNAAGALVPTPGGLGAVEAALDRRACSIDGRDPPRDRHVGGRSLFRALTFWAPRPVRLGGDEERSSAGEL